jgi:hypothetical protein
METIEEAFADLYNSHINNADHFDENDVLDASHFAFVSGVKFAQRWIPVEEELPENFKVVLVKDVKHRVFTAKITPDGWVDQQKLKYCQYRITCWRHVELK